MSSAIATPIKLGPKFVLPHRLVMAPMTRRQCGPDGIPTDKVAEHYANRSSPETGFAMIITEGVFVNAKKELVGETPSIPHIGNEEAIKGWKKVTDAIRKTSGGKTLSCIQLWHTGRFAGMTSPPGAESVGPVDDEYDLPAPASSSSTSTTNASPEELKKLTPKAQVHGLTKQEILDLVQDYATAAHNSIHKAGFDAIEAHFAHGYLLDSFISPVHNTRTDEFGGKESLENRLRFPCMIIKAMREAVGSKDVPIILRTSQWSVMDYNAKNYRTPAELEFALQKFVEAGIDAIHISTRRVTDPGFPDDHPTRTLAGWASYFLKEKKSCGEDAAKNVLVIGVGSVCVSRNFAGRQEYGMTGDEFKLVDPTPALELVGDEKKEIDLLALGRAAIADADICGKLLSGNWKDVKPYQPSTIKVYP